MYIGASRALAFLAFILFQSLSTAVVAIPARVVHDFLQVDCTKCCLCKQLVFKWIDVEKFSGRSHVVFAMPS